MKRKNIKMFIPALLCIVSSISASVTLSLKAEKTSFLLGEPVIVYTTVTNTGTDSVRVFPELGPETDVYHYVIKGPDGKEKTVSPSIVTEPSEFVTLQKNEKISGAARIFFGGEGFYFTEPGNYKVTVKTKIAGAALESRPLSLRILKPANDAQSEQAKLVLERNEMGLYLILEGSEALGDANARIDSMLSKYPESPLLPYFQYARAHNLSIPARNFVTKKPRGAKVPEALEILEVIKEKDAAMLYRKKIHFTLSSCLVKSGKKKEAQDALKNFERILNAKKSMQPYFERQLKEEINRQQ